MRSILILIIALSVTIPASADNRDIQKQISDAKRKVISTPGFGLVGKVEKGSKTPYSINGEDFVVTDTTQIEGDMRIGATAEATGKLIAGGRKIAEVIVVANPNRSVTDSSSPELARQR